MWARARGSSARAWGGTGRARHARIGHRDSKTRLSPSRMTALTYGPAWNPSMPVFGVDRLRGRREPRIGEGSYSALSGGPPVHGRPTIGTKVEGDGISAIRRSGVGLRIAGNNDVFAQKERSDAVGATGSALARDTMAQGDLSRIARATRGKLPADACRKACRRQIILRRDLVAERAAAISN